jgi:hypothetical protein
MAESQFGQIIKESRNSFIVSWRSHSVDMHGKRMRQIIRFNIGTSSNPVEWTAIEHLHHLCTCPVLPDQLNPLFFGATEGTRYVRFNVIDISAEAPLFDKEGLGEMLNISIKSRFIHLQE